MQTAQKYNCGVNKATFNLEQHKFLFKYRTKQNSNTTIN